MKDKTIPHFHLDVSGELLFGLINNLDEDHSKKKSLDGRLALIDRDGVIVKKAPKHQYHTSSDSIELIEGVGEAIHYINEKKIPVAIITNQPGIYKKFHTEKDLYGMNQVIQTELKKYGAHIDSVFFCPHPAPTEGDNINIDKVCRCRKPQPGMINEAIKLYDAEINETFFFEDFESGLQAAKNAGVQGVYVATQHDEFEKMQDKIKTAHPEIFKNFQYSNLLEAVKSTIK
jgi:D-glycero-D-manno-heptose 1,7-bisphosphate phosphatase